MELTLVRAIEALPASSYGGYMQLSNSDVVLLVAIAAEKDACEALARALLFMEADEEVTADDMSDAMGEIVNMVGGGMKTKGADLHAGLTLGLPFFVEGHLEVPSEIEFSGSEVKVGEHTVWVSIIKRDVE
ncbi:MAG: chemotaxis protein CheX [Deltaproteobacteria bacterium]|nr:chemotaxis protein CheX [Deltaproteobacteria bacterium]